MGGVAFAIKDRKVTPVVIEFSEGFRFNTTNKKEQDDETKMVGNILNLLKSKEALQIANYPIPQHYIRFFGGEIVFECICLLKNEEYIKRKYFTITYPTTCEELILFVKKMPHLLDWKHTINMQTKQMLGYE
ncbi:hypothetical protein BDF20DRAFT_844593 [Mycotypha africana]|uniref:uncharacterized protein n=1 Tax=Mycotypha africana TaxID=64632 RepID=UPI002300ECFE|nr:uncharacterized protein BDF20DRAFT_844593 [Mycotypha africana]KAI8991423.1 hypothetical protein BDF20DRAFT_844593 [Mycotypha africana]